jgi:hypothetical protein
VTFYAFCAGVVMDGDTIRGIITESKSGREAVLGRIVVDCTGDADVAFRAGVPCEKGNETGGMQPPTLMFCIGGVDTEKLRMSIAQHTRTYLTDFIPAEYFGQNHQFIVVGLRELIAKARAERKLNIPNERTIIITGLREGEVWINMTRVAGTDGTDARSLTAGEIEARGQIEDIYIYLKNYVPGFEKCFFYEDRTLPRHPRDAPHRRPVHDDPGGRARLSPLRGQHRGGQLSDRHSPPRDEGCTLIWCGDCYDIPFRSLVPQKVKNLLVAGRCISTTHEAMGAIRVMATCMAMGEAAGRAAKQAIRAGIAPTEVDVKELQAELRAKGAYLRESQA